MFGKDWQKAEATIVSNDGVYVLEVRTAMGGTFQAEAKPPDWDFSYPHAGETAGVLYDEKSQKVKFDKDDPRNHRPSTITRLQDVMGSLQSAGAAQAEGVTPVDSSTAQTIKISSVGTTTPIVIGTGIGGVFDAMKMLKSGPLADMIHEAQRDPEGFRQRMIAQAEAAGVHVETLSAGAHIVDRIHELPAAAPDASHDDVLDQITKLADLKDKGVLTDAEFQQAKRKLLGNS